MKVGKNIHPINRYCWCRSEVKTQFCDAAVTSRLTGLRWCLSIRLLILTVSYTFI